MFVRSKNLNCKFLNHINCFIIFANIVWSNLSCVLFCNCIRSTIDIRSYDKSSFHFHFTSISRSKLSNFFFFFSFVHCRNLRIREHTRGDVSWDGTDACFIEENAVDSISWREHEMLLPARTLIPRLGNAISPDRLNSKLTTRYSFETVLTFER